MVPRLRRSRRGPQRRGGQATQGRTGATAVADLARPTGPHRGHARGRHRDRPRPRPRRDRGDHELHDTSNPSVMLGAGLVAKKAVEAGLDVKPWVKTSLRPGSTVVTDYLKRSGLDKYLDKLNFNLVGYGCDVHRQFGPLPEVISEAVEEKDLVVCSVLRQPQFRGPDQPRCPRQHLASPRLCVATHSRGRWSSTSPGSPSARAPTARPSIANNWPSSEEVKDTVPRLSPPTCSPRATPTSSPATSARRGRRPGGRPLRLARLDLRRRPSFFEGMDEEPKPVEPIEYARVLAVLGDRSPATTSPRPARSRRRARPASGCSRTASRSAT